MTRLNKILNITIICSQEQRYSILKIIEKLGETNYSVLMNIIYPNQSKSSAFAYNIRKLLRCGVVIKNQQTKSYKLTDKGQKVLKLINQYQEKYVNNDESSICKNEDKNNHIFIKICQKCGYIERNMIVN